MWNKNTFGHVGSEILKLEMTLKNTKEASIRRETLSKLQEWRQKEEILWWQQARVDFLKFGDANTQWFHSRANMCRAQNKITKLLDDTGSMQTDATKVVHIVIDFFRQLFSGATSLSMEAVLDCVHPCVTEPMNAQLFLPYSRAEVEKALSQINPHKAPRPEGLNAFFFQKHWDIISDDVCAAC